MDTRAVCDHHFAALGSGNIDEVLQDFTDTSVLLTADGAYQGLETLRAFFSAAVSGIFKPGTYSLTLDAVRVEGEVGYYLWHASCQGVEIVLGTDTFVVRDGKITAQTFAARMEPK